MAFNNNTRSARTTYFSVAEGKVRVRLKEATDGSVARQNKKGEIVHEFVYDEFTGRITSIGKDEAPFGTQWRIDFEDSGEAYTLNMMYDSSTAQKMLNVLLAPELDIAKPVTLRPYNFTNDKGKQIVGVSVLQKGTKIGPAFGTHAYPIDGRPEMPELEVVKFKGKDQYDSTKRLEFLADQVATRLQPKFATSAPVAVESVPTTNDGGDDELPF
jgi:hypothetical protein